VERFLAGEIGFLDIARAVEDTLAHCQYEAPSSLDDVLMLDTEARRAAGRWLAVGSAAE